MAGNSLEVDLGDLVHDSFDFKHITWKIPNVLSLPNLLDYKVRSSIFPFAGATWRLVMYPYGKSFYKSEGFIDLVIVRLDYRIPEHHMFFKFIFKTRQGKEFKSYSDSIYFISNASEMGVVNFMKKSTFLEKKNIIAPNGVLTIVCQLRTKKAAVMDRHSQIESCTAISGSDPTTESKLSAPIHIHGIKILNDLKELFLKQEDCDVIIKVKGREFQAHKLILRARSPVFASTFHNDMKEKSTGIIDIEDCDPDTFSNFLSFLYSGDIENLSVDNVFSLFTTSDKYDVQDLRKKCLEFMRENLSVETICDTIRLAVLHSETELIKLSTDFFAKNLQDILVTVKWQVFLAENITLGNELLIKALALNKSSK